MNNNEHPLVAAEGKTYVCLGRVVADVSKWIVSSMVPLDIFFQYQ